MFFKEVPNAKHERHHFLVDRRPQLLLTRIDLLLHVAEHEGDKLPTQPYGRNMPSPHGEKILKVAVSCSCSRVQTQMEVAHSMLHPVSTERGRRTRYKHV